MLEALSRLEYAVPAGVLDAAGLVLLARWLVRRHEMRVYAVVLGLTAVAYLLFGLRSGAPSGRLLVEASGALLFGAAALLGARCWPALLALGWTGHVVWDLSLHHAAGPAFAPAWYPLFCVGFDLFLGGYIAGAVIAARAGSPR